MPVSSGSGIRAHPAAGSERQWLVFSDEIDPDDAQESGRWIKAAAPVEIKQ